MNLNQFPLWTAVVTPLKKDGSVDYDSFLKILKSQESAKNGILILGSTGESLNLDEEERQEIVKFTCKQKLKVPLMAGIGGIHLPSTLEWLAFLEEYPIDCYLMVTPLYAKPGTLGQIHWFESLLNKATRPCMLYNVPGRAGASLSFEAVEKLSSHENCWAIKEASGKTEHFERYVKAMKGKPVYSGDDGMLVDFFNLGCKGLVSVAANTWPEATNLYVHKVLEKQLQKNPQDVQMWTECSDALFLASNPVPAKVLMQHQGVIATALTRPPLDYRDLKDTKELFNANTRIENWLKENR